MSKPEVTDDVAASKPNVETTESLYKPTNATEGKGKDKAAALLASNERIVVTSAENKRVLKKIDLVILPILLSVYFLQSLDKTTLSYASVFGLIEDANLDPNSQQYSWLGSIVYIAQLVAQPLVAVLLVKLRMGKFMGVMVFTWGCILCGMAGASSFAGLMATRFLLGAFEAAVAPAFIAVVQMWYKRGEQTNRNAAWYAMLGMVNIIGSLLCYGLGHIQSNLLYSYQIIFLFCGLLTVVVSVFVWLFMPDSPMEAKFFNDHEKLVAVERLRMNQMGVASRVWKWDHVLEAFMDPKTWLWFSMLTAISIPSGGISAFGPLIIQSFGFGPFATILFNMPFGVIQIIATCGGAWLATRLKRKSPVLILLCIPPIAGIVILMVVGRGDSNRGVLLLGYYLTSFYPGISPLIYSWSGQNTGGDTKRKVTTSILFVGASAGNIIGPQLFKPSEKPHYYRGLRANLALFIAIVVLILLAMFWIKLLNRKHAATRESMGKSAIVVDTSMGSAREGDAEGAENAQASGVGDKAFDDVTDMKNEDFIYVY
ncbi:major facilitator superfamily domain-containing protein [Alternaria rosae]|uniref:major facilitator superfamily domain-containing protein n=1 Tax=Alternaria rosae TaxID=1187941 RepID=UPI001E8DE2AF|nr:major facilitator superfamily domain-containing protein [Alternaria rosae]KAH6877647.1 major facilitator superfamily domain-containing protein [Alternaria rosae]